MALAIDSQEASNTAHRLATGTPLTWTFTNTAGTLLIVGVVVTQGSGTATTPTVTYGGVSMGASVVSVTWATGASRIDVFALVNPPTGANTVSIATTSGAQATLAGAISFTGNDATTPIGLTATANDGGGTATHALAGSIAAASGSYVLGVGGWGSGATATADHATTFALVGTGGTAGDDIATDIALSSGTAINPGFTWVSADHWGMAGVEIKSATPAAATGPSFMPGRMPLGA